MRRSKTQSRHASGSGKVVKKPPAPRVDESGKEHAPLPPSASSRWIACPPSMAYVQMLVEAKVIKKRVSGPAAQRGTRIHTWGEQFIRWMMLGKSTTGVKPKGKDEADEMQEARDYAAYCVDQVERERVVTRDVKYGVEDRAVVDPVYCWGSRDFWFYGADMLTVLDLKSGREPVVIEGNTQLLIYAMDKFYELMPKRVRLLIWQPNSDEGGDPDKEFVYTATQFSAHARKINGYVERARNWFGRTNYRDLEDALKAGDHCGWCDALGVCPKARKYASAISKGAFDVIGEETPKRKRDGR